MRILRKIIAKLIEIIVSTNIDRTDEKKEVKSLSSNLN
jgi:hypothetical protein